MGRRFIPAFLAAAVLACGILASGADEGMWTFDNPPVDVLRETYGFTPSPEWLEKLRLSAVRINDGGSGSFVSDRGLVMTNHHVALGQVQKLSTPENDYVSQGFYASREEDELPCPDLEINVLVSLENVTEEVRKAISEDMDDIEALAARRGAMARIEKESLSASGLRSNVVSLYNGGEYWLHRYKQYKDVRLVFAPESQAAFFGGDTDNFTYPRYDLDVAFLRVYEDGEPAETDNYLTLEPEGPEQGELVFVVGNPGSTDRLFTGSQRDYQRDVRYPTYLEYFGHYIDLLELYGEKGPEARRQIVSQLLSLTNAEKAFAGEYEGLLNEALMARLAGEEAEFRAKVVASAELQEKYGHAWEEIDRAVDTAARSFVRRVYRAFVGSRQWSTALALVRYAAELQKPDEERLPGFHDSRLDSLRFQLLSPAPFYPELEEVVTGGFLELTRQKLGDDDAFVETTLAGRPAREVARELLRDSSIPDVEVRKALLEGGTEAIEASADPLIVMARKLDPLLRDDEKRFREEVESVLARAGEDVASARFALLGKSVPPDATFTLRLTFGTVKGYPMNGTKAPYRTTLYGLFDRSVSFGRTGEYALPERFWDRRDKLDLETPVNFVSTVDIIGGNSGSPVVNREGEAVGLIFDGNIESLVGRFAYDSDRARAVAVHPAYILEALSKLYDADMLVDELKGKPRTP